jgi:hypothetical protein
LNNEKLNALIEGRNEAKKEWIALENAFNQMDPSLKKETQQALFQQKKIQPSNYPILHDNSG